VRLAFYAMFMFTFAWTNDLAYSGESSDVTCVKRKQDRYLVKLGMKINSSGDYKRYSRNYIHMKEELSTVDAY
jgi:hypothetical protein